MAKANSRITLVKYVRLNLKQKSGLVIRDEIQLNQLWNAAEGAIWQAAPDNEMMPPMQDSFNQNLAAPPPAAKAAKMPTRWHMIYRSTRSRKGQYSEFWKSVTDEEYDSHLAKPSKKAANSLLLAAELLQLSPDQWDYLVLIVFNASLKL